MRKSNESEFELFRLFSMKKFRQFGKKSNFQLMVGMKCTQIQMKAHTIGTTATQKSTQCKFRLRNVRMCFERKYVDRVAKEDQEEFFFL